MADAARFTPKFNSEADFRIIEVGIEHSRIIVVDNALLNPEDLIEFASTSAVFAAPRTTIYPGINAPFGQETVLATVAVLRTALREAYGVPVDYKLACNGYLGLITASPTTLTPYQAIPHVDTTAPNALAILLYLCTNKHGGTGFYRHRVTGFETLSVGRMADYTCALTSEVSTRAGETPEYFIDSNFQFERIAKIDAAYNRLIVYPSNLFHSAIVDPERLSADPRSGRLTANIFVAG